MTILDAGDEAHVVVAVHPMRVTAHVLVATRRRELGGGGKVPGPKPAGGVLVAWDLDEESGGGGGGPRPARWASLSLSLSLSLRLRLGLGLAWCLGWNTRSGFGAWRCASARTWRWWARRRAPSSSGGRCRSGARGARDDAEAGRRRSQRRRRSGKGGAGGPGHDEEDGEEEDIASQFEALGGELRDEE